MDSAPQSTARKKICWREPEVLLLLVLVGLAQFVRLGDLTARGEESRRATVALEMLRTGDWLVPHQQGEPYFSRPPLQNWLIAGATLLHGECDIWATRLPSALATLLTTLLVFGYTRTFLPRPGAFAAAAAFATMPQVLQLGGLAETEALFTLLISGSLLIWHWGWSRGWPAVWLWMLSYALAALGTLTKGPQAPVYFVTSVSVFLLLTGQSRRLWSWAHLLGLCTFAAIFGAWFVPYTLRMGLPAAWNILCGNAVAGFWTSGVWQTILHFLKYPLNMFGNLLPWSLCLLVYLHRPFRQTIGVAGANVRFLLVCLAVTFPTCWIAPGAQPRYWMPLMPCCAPLIGLVIQRGLEAAAGSPLRRWWTWYVTAAGIFLACIPVLTLAGGHLEQRFGWPLAQPSFLLALGIAVTMTCLLVLLFRQRRRFDPAGFQMAVFALAACVTLTYSGWYVNLQINQSVGTQQAVEEVKTRLSGVKLVSFDNVHHLFPFYYQEQIPRLDWPESAADVPADCTYFCFTTKPRGAKDKPLPPTAHPYDPPHPLPFDWKPVALIRCDRNVRQQTEWVVVVGKRLNREEK